MSDSVIVFGHIVSQPVRSVMAYLKLSNIAFNFEVVDLVGGAHLSPEFTQLNPYQTIPTLMHGEFTVWESAAMIPYISESFNVDNQWYPKDPKQRARIDAYLHWHHQNVREPCTTYIRAKVIAPKFYGAPELTEEKEAVLRARFLQFLEDLKWTLASTGYVARSSNATIADIFAFNELSAMLRLFNIEDHPEIKKWFEEIAVIPAVDELSQQAFKLVGKLLG